MKRMGWLAPQVVLLVAVLTVLSGSLGMAASAPRYQVRYLVPPGPLAISNGMRLDAKGNLYIAQNAVSRVQRLDLRNRSLTLLIDEFASNPLKFPDDIEIGPDGTPYAGTLYFTEPFERSVSRMEPDPDREGQFLAPERFVVGITDGRTAPNGMAFDNNPDPNKRRLFVTDMIFDPTYEGGMWEVLLPDGPARQIVRDIPSPNAFDFDSDNIAWVPTNWDGSIYKVDVDAVIPTATLYATNFRDPHDPTAVKGNLTALKVDPQGRLVVLASNTGQVWRVSRTDPADRTLVAQGERGFDNLEIDADGTIYVSSFLTGNIGRVNEASGKITPLLPQSALALPGSVSEAPDGSLLVADLVSLVRVAPDGQATRPHVPFLDSLLLATGGALEIEGTEFISDSVYFTEFLPPRRARVCRLDTTKDDPCDALVTSGLLVPWHIRRGPGNQLLVIDHGTGTVFELDRHARPSTPIPLATGLHKPAGLAYDAQHDKLYVSENQRGQVVEIDRETGVRRIVVMGLATPEGVALDASPEALKLYQKPTLLVVEAGTGRLLRFNIPKLEEVLPEEVPIEVIASGLPTKTSGALPALLDYTADVLVRSNGTILVTGNAEGSLIEITRR